MCGIYATNCGTLYENILNLQTLEYRGYDSSGFIYIDKHHRVGLHKDIGNVSSLMLSVKEEDIDIVAFAGHTRWATHGKVSTLNAHPHLDINNRYAIVHNGIVENYIDLMQQYRLSNSLKTETDTEVLINIIAAKCKNNTLLSSIDETVAEIEGANSFIVLDTLDPLEFYAITKGSKLDIFVSKVDNQIKGVHITSNSLASYNDGYCLLFKDSDFITKINNDICEVQSLHKCTRHNIAYASDKNGYDTFMHKEIYEQPQAVENLLRGRLHKNQIVLGGLQRAPINEIKDIKLLACGSSLNAAQLGQRYLEEISRIKSTVEQAAEFRYRNPLTEEDLYIFISQSGETADVLEAMKYVQSHSSGHIMGICNNVGSTLSKETDFGIYTRAGQEIGVASTKTYTNQAITLLLLSLFFKMEKDISEELYKLPQLIYTILHDTNIISLIDKLALSLSTKSSCIFLGRGYNYPTALESALKMKELTYIHAEGYSAAEMKHGPLALVDSSMPVIFFVNEHDNYNKAMSNVNEIMCRNGDVTIITDKECSLDVQQIIIPKSSKYISPILCNIISQLLSYKTATILKKNVDQPRNLAKSVTVE